MSTAKRSGRSTPLRELLFSDVYSSTASESPLIGQSVSFSTTSQHQTNGQQSNKSLSTSMSPSLTVHSPDKVASSVVPFHTSHVVQRKAQCRQAQSMITLSNGLNMERNSLVTGAHLQAVDKSTRSSSTAINVSEPASPASFLSSIPNSSFAEINRNSPEDNEFSIPSTIGGNSNSPQRINYRMLNSSSLKQFHDNLENQSSMLASQDLKMPKALKANFDGVSAQDGCVSSLTNGNIMDDNKHTSFFQMSPSEEQRTMFHQSLKYKSRIASDQIKPENIADKGKTIQSTPANFLLEENSDHMSDSGIGDLASSTYDFQPCPSYASLTPWTNKLLSTCQPTTAAPDTDKLHISLDSYSHQSMLTFPAKVPVHTAQSKYNNESYSKLQPRSAEAASDGNRNHKDSGVASVQKNGLKISQNKQHRFKRTADALQKSGLLDVAMKTGNLIKRNRELQKELDTFRVDALTFLKSVIKNPQNRNFIKTVLNNALVSKNASGNKSSIMTVVSAAAAAAAITAESKSSAKTSISMKQDNSTVEMTKDSKVKIKVSKGSFPPTVAMEFD